MPYEDYRELFTNCLDEDHTKIFEFLTVNKKNRLLEFKKLEKKYLEVIQYGEVELRKKEMDQLSQSDDEQPEKNQQQDE